MNGEKLYQKLFLLTAACVLYALPTVTAQTESGIDPEALIERILAATTGSLGTENGSLSMTTQLNASPWTSTPCQKLLVANNTALGVCRKESNRPDLLFSPCSSIG